MGTWFVIDAYQTEAILPRKESSVSELSNITVLYTADADTDPDADAALHCCRCSDAAFQEPQARSV